MVWPTRSPLPPDPRCSCGASGLPDAVAWDEPWPGRCPLRPAAPIPQPHRAGRWRPGSLALRCLLLSLRSTDVLSIKTAPRRAGCEDRRGTWGGSDGGLFARLPPVAGTGRPTPEPASHCTGTPLSPRGRLWRSGPAPWEAAGRPASPRGNEFRPGRLRRVERDLTSVRERRRGGTIYVKDTKGRGQFRGGPAGSRRNGACSRSATARSR